MSCGTASSHCYPTRAYRLRRSPAWSATSGPPARRPSTAIRSGQLSRAALRSWTCPSMAARDHHPAVRIPISDQMAAALRTTRELGRAHAGVHSRERRATHIDQLGGSSRSSSVTPGSASSTSTACGTRSRRSWTTGGTPPTIADLMGHKNVKMFETIYRHRLRPVRGRDARPDEQHLGQSGLAGDHAKTLRPTRQGGLCLSQVHAGQLVVPLDVADRDVASPVQQAAHAPAAR